MDLKRKKTTRERSRAGFSLIEVLVGMTILAVAVLGLAQMFLLSVTNNAKASEVTNAVFLAQQQIDLLRTLTYDELAAFPNTSAGQSDDEVLDVNSDGTPDFRRLTAVTADGSAFDVRILVFPAVKIDTARETLLADPQKQRVRADIHTLISR